MNTGLQPSGTGYTLPDMSCVRAHDPVEFVVCGRAEPAGSKRAIPVARDWKTRPGVRWRVVDANPRAKSWQAEVAKAAAAAMGERELLDGPLFLFATFYAPKPKSVRRAFPTVKPDLTKLLRGLEDAMTGVIYRDDAQIIEQFMSKRYGTQARVHVRVVPIPPGEGEHDRSRRA